MANLKALPNVTSAQKNCIDIASSTFWNRLLMPKRAVTSEIWTQLVENLEQIEGRLLSIAAHVQFEMEIGVFRVIEMC